MRPWMRWTVTAVLAIDALCALAFLSSEIFKSEAGAPPKVAAPQLQVEPAAKAPEAKPVVPMPTEPAAATPAVAAPADFAAGSADTIPGAGPDDPTTPREQKNVTKSDAFLRLLRAYENMEPESAAKALAELATRDRRAVVELVLGSKPRTSGAILDALTQTHPGLAADLSYEIWRRAQTQG
jgi:hypothetical protein